MASATLRPSNGLFPALTSVGAYEARYKMPGHAPAATAVTTSTVATDGSVTFTDLTDGVQYVAYANVSGQHRYLDFAALPATEVSGTLDLANENEYSLTGGPSPKFVTPEGRAGFHVDEFGALIGGGIGALAPDGSMPASGTFQRRVPDFMVAPGPLGRLFSHSQVVTEIDDPADITFRRAGPGYPYAGGRGLAAMTAGSKVLTITAGDDIFRAGQEILGAKLGGPGATGIPAGTTIESTDMAPRATTGTITLSTEATVTQSLTVYSVGRPEDITAWGAGAIIGQIRIAPFVALWDPVAGAPGGQDMPGAFAPRNSATMHLMNSEQPAVLTDDPDLSDLATGSHIRFSITRNGRTTPDHGLELAEDGCVLVGLGAITAGTLGDLMHVRGHGGNNEKQTLSVVNATGGTFQLGPYTDPAADRPALYTLTTPIAYNASAAAVKAALEPALLTMLQTQANPAIPGALLADVEVTCTGGPLGTAGVLIEFTGPLVKKRNWLRMRRPSALTGTGAKVTLAKTLDGIPDRHDKRLLFIRDGANSDDRTTDYIAVQDKDGNAVWQLDKGGSQIMGSAFIGVKEMTAPTAPTVDRVRIYAEDSGGKTRLMALFNTGAAQQIAIQP